MTLLLIFLASEAGGLLAIINGQLALGLLTVLIGSQAAARHDDGWRQTHGMAALQSTTDDTEGVLP